MKGLERVEEAIARIREGGMIIVVDDEHRENEGDLIMAAERVTPEAVNFMTVHGRGLVCVALGADRLRALQLSPMTPRNTSRLGTAFTVSVDAAEGTTTGTSAHDRARTIEVLADPAARPEDLAAPGHVFPLAAADGGVLRRPGHTEAAVDLARLAGLVPAGVLCEIMDEDGRMARMTRLRQVAREHRLPVISIGDLVTWRQRTEMHVRRLSRTEMPTAAGVFEATLYRDELTGDEHLALAMGDPARRDDPLVRVHSQCLTGDVFGSRRCDCGWQLQEAMRRIAEEGHGVLLYLRQEGRQIGLANKLRAYELQDEGLDTVEANEALGFAPDPRDYVVAAHMLRDLEVRRVRLLTNNPRKVERLEELGVAVAGRIALETEPNAANIRYLKTKRRKLGHLLQKISGDEEAAGR